MTKEDYIESKVGRETPFKVPEGYFESMVRETEAKLPLFPKKEEPHRLSAWQRLRPYLYFAAMFAGIWCMMKMFHMASNPSTSLEAAPEAIASVMEAPEDYGVYLASNDQDDYELEMELAESYSDFDDLRRDLGIDLQPAYAGDSGLHDTGKI